MDGPLVKDKTSIAISGRRSLLDVWNNRASTSLYSRNISGGSDYNFYDLNLKINHQLSDRDVLYLSAFSGADQYSQRETETNSGPEVVREFKINWSNLNLVGGWKRYWNEKLYSSTVLYFTQYQYGQFRLQEKKAVPGFELRNNFKNSFQYDAGIQDLGAKMDFNFRINEKHRLKWGGQFIKHRFKPGRYDINIISDDVTQMDTIYQDPLTKTAETGLYLEGEWVISPWYTITTGVHWAGYFLKDDHTLSIQPRLSNRFTVANNTLLRLSFAYMRQHLHLLTTDTGGFPTDLWLPATKRVEPQSGWVAASEISHSFNSYEISLGGYYRQLKNTIAYRGGNSILNPVDWQDKVTQ
ncbi:MAG: hypothetical protein AAFY41_16080, partial [Bacteroidota bacterium]